MTIITCCCSCGATMWRWGRQRQRRRWWGPRPPSRAGSLPQQHDMCFNTIYNPALCHYMDDRCVVDIFVCDGAGECSYSQGFGSEKENSIRSKSRGRVCSAPGWHKRLPSAGWRCWTSFADLQGASVEEDAQPDHLRPIYSFKSSYKKCKRSDW